MRRLLLALAAAAALLNLRAEVLGAREQVYLFKPLATALLVALVLPLARRSTYHRWLGLGLVGCLAGDILLMLPNGLFVPGLVAFLTAHMMFIRACSTDGGGIRAGLGAALPIAVAAAGVLMYLWPSLGPMRVPVFCYVFAISTMAWQMLARGITRRTTATLIGAIGAVSFMASDSALAINKFAAPFAGAALVVMGTYYVAIWGLTLSALLDERAA